VAVFVTGPVQAGGFGDLVADEGGVREVIDTTLEDAGVVGEQLGEPRVGQRSVVRVAVVLLEVATHPVSGGVFLTLVGHRSVLLSYWGTARGAAPEQGLPNGVDRRVVNGALGALGRDMGHGCRGCSASPVTAARAATGAALTLRAIQPSESAAAAAAARPTPMAIHQTSQDRRGTFPPCRRARHAQ